MIKLKSNHKKIISDKITPVGLYLTIRDKFPMSFLLESSDYHGTENSFSYICFEPIAKFQVQDNSVIQQLPGEGPSKILLSNKKQAIGYLNEFISSFSFEKLHLKCVQQGLFGYHAYDSVNYFEDIDVHCGEIPSINYQVFRFIVAIDHFHNELHLMEFVKENDPSRLDEVFHIISRNEDPVFYFERNDQEKSNITDEDYLRLVRKGISHCKRGDVFQIVLSRKFSTAFTGDEFNVYRALRSVNPSPYLFYFDYGNFKIFGSSPEAQLIVKDGKASIYPIAGTFRRTGHDSDDLLLAEQLKTDIKENAEHVMLVDLARNDLSRHSDDVEVEVYKEVQYYSHVIHLVSKITAALNSKDEVLNLMAATFPAGTLSGAPKYKAMQLINKYESEPRGYYGGAVGSLSFDGEYNHAIMIRSFFSHSNILYYQAGAGIVADSKPQNELQEVKNKLGALRKAMDLAEQINK